MSSVHEVTELLLIQFMENEDLSSFPEGIHSPDTSIELKLWRQSSRRGRLKRVLLDHSLPALRFFGKGIPWSFCFPSGARLLQIHKLTEHLHTINESERREESREEEEEEEEGEDLCPEEVRGMEGH